jgi:uncharacterized protein YhhL (DUF1145 family)
MGLLELLMLERIQRNGDMGCGCFGTIALIFVIALIIDLITSHIREILIFLLILFIFFIIIKGLNTILDNAIHKDETPEEREERLKTEKMIKEWKNKF